MYIKEIVIDGFKSYANRTVVPDFDPYFNAITGLNGSGKSNILDAICFVLGITQLSQVRVSNLQGLVYKQGQSGVTKASVSIVFDNSDPECSPVEHQNEKEITVTRQVVIGGRNKYLINGRNAQANKVQNLFHSVQLNVNNPHFLIMQGRITKVLNMKPPEILGMIEEAVGTRMYETKKAQAQKKMEQKQTKVEEIEKLLAEEITPKLEKLRTEKQSYLKWASQNTEMERLHRFCIAHRFMQSQETRKQGSSKKKALEVEMQELKAKRTETKAKMKEIKAQESPSQIRKLEKELETIGDEEDELSKALVKHTTVLQNQKSAYEAFLAKKTGMEKQQEDFEVKKKSLREKADAMQAEANKLKEIFLESKKALQNAQTGLQAANAGLANDVDENGTGDAQQLTMQEKLVILKRKAEEASTNIKQNEMKIDHVKQELKEVNAEAKKAKTKDSKIQKELQKYEVAVKNIEDEISKLDYNPEEAHEVEEELSAKEAELTDLRDTASQLEAQLSAFDFTFQDPSPNFDRIKVKGIVAKLAQVPDSKNATALEVVAGGKLYQVVVDAVETGKLLLSKGKLKRRVTIIPLDKVASRGIPAAKVKAADAIASEVGGFAKPALSLIGYEDDVAKAMEYVFGATLVCDTLATARSVTFNKLVQVKSVTLEGDAFDPQGTLSGGSKSSRGSVLVQLQRLREIHDQIASVEASVAVCKEKLAAWKSSSSKHEKLSEQLDLAQHELNLVLERVKATPFAQLSVKEEELKVKLDELEAEIMKFEKLRDETSLSASEMEEEMKDMESARNRLAEVAKETLQAAKKRFEADEKKFEKARDNAENALLEVDQLAQDQQAMKESVDDAESKSKQTLSELNKLQKEVDKRAEAFEDAHVVAEAKRAELKEAHALLKELNRSLSDLEREQQACELQMKELQGELKRSSSKCEEAVRKGERMLEQYPWIESEQHFFGKPHTDFDFNAKSPNDAEARLRKLEEAQSQMSRNVNKKVMGMIGKAEQEYEELNKKRAIIEKDRKTIERVIKDLDTKKNEVLKSTWEKVNNDFGSIFSTLLPGTQAKLEPPENGTILDGLEVRVAFGNTWKKSLTELSGGQRSLLALSLILSLLLFKPAPMYILDEVDAALDLSHTQNIGQMLRTHFAHSQFIVVSLKEGMFNNANVIFRTKFVDGVSTVARTSNKENVKRIQEEEQRKEKKTAKVGQKKTRDQNLAMN